MGLFRRLLNELEYRAQPIVIRQSPNAQPATTPASMPNQPQTQSGVQRPLPGGAQAVNVVLDVNGNGIAQLGPTRVREHWQVAGVGVKVGTAVKQAQCSVFIGPSLSSATFLSSTSLGSSGATCGVAGQDIQSGQLIFAQWTGGDAGATATMTVFGTYSIGVPSQ
jgi:hypothetical protein